MNTKIRIIAFSLALVIVTVANGQTPGNQGATQTNPSQPEAGPETVAPQSGRFEIIKEEIRLPDRFERVWVGPVFREGFDACGRPVQVMVSPGRYELVRIPGGREIRERKVWVPAPPAWVGPGAFFTLHNGRKFRVQLQSIHVALADGTTALVALPADRVISSTKRLSFPLPAQAVSVSVRFKRWDWVNRRFLFPILAVHYPLEGGDPTITVERNTRYPSHIVLPMSDRIEQ